MAAFISFKKIITALKSHMTCYLPISDIFIYWDRQSMENQKLIWLSFDLLASDLENRMNYPIILPFAPTWKALQKYAGGQGRKKFL